jgi:hypothetical protein
MLKNLADIMINHENFFLRNHQEFVVVIIIRLLFLQIENDYLFIEAVFLQVL